jgi:hypothetical protein
VVIEDCTFEESKIVDDMVHCVYSDVRFLRCKFLRALSDALDTDISKVLVEDCVFIDSGGDAIDLMTTGATIVGTTLDGSTDKGISSGENSQVLVIDTLFHKCDIGIQAKDRSQVLVFNCDFVSCKWALDAYKKNWQYGGGGHAYIHKSRFFDNSVPLRADSKSSMWVDDSYIDRKFDFKPNRIHLTPSVDVGSETAVRSHFITTFPGEAIGSKVDAGYMSRVRPVERGSTLFSGKVED